MYFKIKPIAKIKKSFQANRGRNNRGKIAKFRFRRAPSCSRIEFPRSRPIPRLFLRISTPWARHHASSFVIDIPSLRRLTIFSLGDAISPLSFCRAKARTQPQPRRRPSGAERRVRHMFASEIGGEKPQKTRRKAEISPRSGPPRAAAAGIRRKVRGKRVDSPEMGGFRWCSNSWRSDH